MKRPPLGAVLLHPIALVALCVLALNDHVLKAQCPGIVTGKLSDFSGMIVAPLFLVACLDAIAPAYVIARRHYAASSAVASVVVVAITFALAKTWAPATHLYESALSFVWHGHVHLVRDPTDLIALPMGAFVVPISRLSRRHLV